MEFNMKKILLAIDAYMRSEPPVIQWLIIFIVCVTAFDVAAIAAR